MPWGTIGGTEIATLRLAQAMADAEIASVMFCRVDSPLVAAFFNERGFEIAAYDQRSFEAGLGSFARATVRMGREFNRQGIDVVACADLAALETVAAAARMRGLPLISHIRNPYAWLTPLQRGWLLGANELVFCSENALTRFGSISKFGPRIAARIANVVYDVVDLDGRDVEAGTIRRVAAEVRQEFGISAHVKIVGMVARIARQKDHLTLLRAAERVIERYPDVRFLIVGDSGPESLEQEHGAAVRSAVDASPARRHFVFTGYRSDIVRITSALDIAVLCSHFEGFGLTNLEAMVLRKPVVATNVGGVPEVVIDGETGFLHAHEDDAQLAECLLLLLEDGERAVRFGEAGRRFAQARFGTARFKAEMTQIYRRAASTGPQPFVKLGRKVTHQAIAASR